MSIITCDVFVVNLEGLWKIQLNVFKLNDLKPKGNATLTDIIVSSVLVFNRLRRLTEKMLGNKCEYPDNGLAVRRCRLGKRFSSVGEVKELTTKTSLLFSTVDIHQWLRCKSQSVNKNQTKWVLRKPFCWRFFAKSFLCGLFEFRSLSYFQTLLTLKLVLLFILVSHFHPGYVLFKKEYFCTLHCW